jgi:hypothetical protein
MAKYSREPTYDDPGYNEPIDLRYLEEKYVPSWVMNSAMRYHHAQQGRDSKPWMRNAKPDNDL